MAIGSTARSTRHWRRGVPWLAVGTTLLVLVGAASARGVPFYTVGPAVGYAHALGSVPNESIVMNLTDAPSFQPRFISAAPGQNVSIQLDNLGTLRHTFTLSSQSGVPLNRSDTPAELNATFNAHAPIVNVSVPPGTDDLWANFSVPANASFDSFEFASQIPYQFQAGMWGYLNISSSAPPYLLSDNTTNALSFQPAALSVSPSHYPANAQIVVTNLGDLGHTFTLAAQANTTLSTIGYFHAHVPLVNISIPASTGGSNFSDFKIPAPGVYEFVCTVLGHFAGGMYGFLYVGVPVPAVAAPPSTAIVETYVLAGSAVLLGIGGLLVLVGSFTGRLSPPPPPAHGDE